MRHLVNCQTAAMCCTEMPAGATDQCISRCADDNGPGFSQWVLYVGARVSQWQSFKNSFSTRHALYPHTPVVSYTVCTAREIIFNSLCAVGSKNNRINQRAIAKNCAQPQTLHKSRIREVVCYRDLLSSYSTAAILNAFRV